MNIKEANAIDMVYYLSVRGYNPIKISGSNYWYKSPLPGRNERTASFKVDRQRNRWKDFGDGRGGGLLDFILLLDGIPIHEALKKLTGFDPGSIPPIPPKEPTPSIEVISTHLISSFALVRYCHHRRIPAAITDTWLKEVRYKNSDRIFYALGFQNDAGGYELRSPNFKGSSSPKCPSLIENDSHSLAVFEGFFDFLSYCTMCQYQPIPKRDYLVLNSTSFFEQQLPIMQTYDQVHLYLDNDATGNKYTQQALGINRQQFIDERALFHPHKDLNDWLVQIGNAPNPIL